MLETLISKVMFSRDKEFSDNFWNTSQSCTYQNAVNVVLTHFSAEFV